MVVHSKLTDSYGNFYVRLGVNSAEQWEGRGRVFFRECVTQFGLNWNLIAVRTEFLRLLGAYDCSGYRDYTVTRARAVRDGASFLAQTIRRTQEEIRHILCYGM